MPSESDFVRLRDNGRMRPSVRGKACRSGLNWIGYAGREGCLTKTDSKAASSLTISGQLTASPDNGSLSPFSLSEAISAVVEFDFSFVSDMSPGLFYYVR